MKDLTSSESQFRPLVSQKIFEFVTLANRIPQLYRWLQDRGISVFDLTVLNQANKIRQDGFTVILVERGEGVETKAIKTSYVSWLGNHYNVVFSSHGQSPTAGTAFVTFDNVKVPVENTLGLEGGGIFVMLRYRSFLPSPHPLYSCTDAVISIMNAGSWFARPQEVNA